jgi:DNA replication protein DnaC
MNIDQTGISFICRALTNNIDRLLQILEFQLQIDTKNPSGNDYFSKNVILTGRSGSGKKTVAAECCQRLWEKYLIYYKFLDCLSFKGKTRKSFIFVC